MVSYGLIVYYQDPGPDKTILYHIGKRRDSLSYIHFLRGKVPSDKITRFFALMTANEKNRLLSCGFDSLWADLHSDTDFKKTSQYQEALCKFETFTKTGAIKRAIEDTKNMNIELDWGFPKGRKKKYNEPDAVCALREYREETRSRCYIEFIDHPPLKVIQQYGTIRHSTYFFIAKSKYKPRPVYYTLNVPEIQRTSISPETSDLSWSNYESAIKKIHPRLSDVLKEADQIIKENGDFIDLQTVIRKYSGNNWVKRDPPHRASGVKTIESKDFFDRDSQSDDSEFANLYGIIKLAQIALELECYESTKGNSSWSFDQISREFNRVWKLANDLPGSSQSDNGDE